ncbi:unnamed protein product [Adineta steineri]|uniref:F-box domain-containing protein n=1 Tax=Adineta steineri TaxID=433720 RepID=A0A815XAV1_9BILA|nr:unnamed protein product [Adineta steineri]CAF1555185.1 unnamed protein product [Adineta steineri]
MVDYRTPSLITVPIELIYCIMDNLDTEALFRSLRDVSTRTNAIMDTYERYKTLTTLHTPAINIGDEGAMYLAEALSFNETLTELKLGYNKISNQGAQYFANALKENTTLKLLELYSNNIDHAGELHFTEALGVNNVVKITGLSQQFERQHPVRI